MLHYNNQRESLYTIYVCECVRCKHAHKCGSSSLSRVFADVCCVVLRVINTHAYIWGCDGIRTTKHWTSSYITYALLNTCTRRCGDAFHIIYKRDAKKNYPFSHLAYSVYILICIDSRGMVLFVICVYIVFGSFFFIAASSFTSYTWNDPFKNVYMVRFVWQHVMVQIPLHWFLCMYMRMNQWRFYSFIIKSIPNIYSILNWMLSLFWGNSIELFIQKVIVEGLNIRFFLFVKFEYVI